LKEVSCKTLGMFFRRAERERVPVARLLDGIPYDLNHLLDKHERIEWSVFCDFMDNASRIWNEDQLAELGGAFINSKFFRAAAVVARLLFSARDVYRFVNKAGSGAGNQMFSCIQPTHIEVGPNHIVLEMRLPPGYRHSRPFWVTTKGGLAAIPQMLALKPAKVQLEPTEWGARYDIVYPSGGAWLAFLVRLVSWPFTVREAARELKEANEVLETRYKELDEARSVLALQATQLSVAHTISQLIHSDLDVGRTLQAVADALVNVGGYLAAHVHVAADVDGKPLELEAGAGTPPQASDPIRSALQSRGRAIGDVRVWHAAGQDPRERGQLLEFVLPTLSMALDNAIRYREITDYREALEIKVAERTAELVQARDTLAQTVRSLEEAQQVRDRIFANINHEIRTPLTLVHLAVSDLKQRYAASFDTRSLQELDGIEMSTRKLLRLVDDLLLLAAGHEGKLQLRVTAVDLARLIELVVAAWRPSAEQKGLAIAFQGPSRCVRHVDEDKIERVVTNLISNAIKFTPQGGSVQVDLREDAEGVTIAVRDTGIGIDEDLRKRLFGRFEQGRPAVHAGSRGSGIGLSIVRELTEAHGGEVSVESPRGGGSVFRVLLPTGAQPRAGITSERDSGNSAPLRLMPADFESGRTTTQLPRILESAGTARATILVAEDDPMLADAIGTLLAKEYRVVLAGDGLTALRMAQQHLPDLLVSDVGMPGMDGLELTRRFRELPGNRLAPVVLLTAYANLSDRLQGFGAGAIDYVVKPFEPAELLARIHSQLELRALALRLHQSEKLAALGTLSAGLAHEMRNPANAIVNAIEPLSELLPAELRQEEHPVAQLVGVLRECATQIALLSRQLLGFRRPGDLEYQRTTVAEVVARAQALTSPLFKKVALREALDYRGPLDCAAPLLTQVLSNLLENGAYAAGDGGWVKLASRADDARLVIEVSDSGEGVPVELRERIFEPFFTTKPPGSGTGLGLTMARQIVERHHGILDVRETSGGTLFHIELPLRAEVGQAQRQRGGGR
jgi:signal transduction histidine kinase